MSDFNGSHIERKMISDLVIEILILIYTTRAYVPKPNKVRKINSFILIPQMPILFN